MAKKSLLLVDADSKSLRMLEVSLRKSGFSVTTAIHAADAREKLRHGAPDLILTDTKLPGDENGFDFVAALKKAPETASVPIIFLSSENKLEQKVAGLELGVEDYLTKPIYIKEVLTRVRVLLDKREKQSLEKRERSSSFAGMLGDMGLVDLMQTVEIGRKTGRLHVETRSQKGTVNFKEGKVTGASCGRLTGERAFYRMLVWNEGAFSMEFGVFDDADVIELSTQGLLMEGMRRVDEWGRLIEQLPPLDHIFEIDFTELVDRLAEIPDEINMLLRLFDGRRTMLQVVDETDFGDLEALEIASKLYFEGLIFDVSDREPAEPSQPHKVEAWLSEPAGANDDDGADDVADDSDADGQILAPNNDSVPPTPAAHAEPTAGNILAPPSGASSLPATGLPAMTTPSAPSTLPLVATLPSTLSSTSLPVRMPPLQAQTIASVRPGTPLQGRSGPGSALQGRSDADEPAPRAGHVARTVTPRPLPVPGDEDQEARTVVSRAAVGATAWSISRKGAAKADGDDWEDIVAPDDATPADGTPVLGGPPSPPLLVPTPASLVAAPPPPSLLASLTPPGAAPSMPPVSMPPTSMPPTSMPPTSTPPMPTEPTAPAADELARELGLSDDELALALAADDGAGNRTVLDNARDDALENARPADDDDALAASIAAQLDEPAALPPELARADDESAADRDTDKGRRNVHGKKKPPPTPHTSAPSALTVTPSIPDPAPVAKQRDTAANDANDANAIHERRTQLDIEPVNGRFGVSKAMAAAVFGIGFVVVAGLVVALNDGPVPASFDGGLVIEARDAGAGVVAVDDADADADDAGGAVAVVPAVVDAGSRSPRPVAVADAGSRIAVVVVDAGARSARPPAADAGFDPGVDPGGDPALAPLIDPQADYARHLKAADVAAKRGEFAKSVRSYKAALALNKDAQPAHLGLGNAYYELDNLEASLFHLERARTLAPADPQVFVLLGAVYQSAGRKGDAVSAYERYLSLAPDGKFARDVKGILRGLKN